ncbi:MAG: hypothetical protein ACKVP4_03660 [Hyphomicrobium sp.]
MSRLSLGVLALVALLSTTTASSAGCVMAGGEATMVTQDLAKFMANAALNNSIKGHGWTAHGAVRMTCDTTTLGLSHCLAQQKACS